MAKICFVCDKVVPESDNLCPACGYPSLFITREDADAWKLNAEEYKLKMKSSFQIGTIKEFEEFKALLDYSGDGQYVLIPDEVDIIGYGVFQCRGIQNITLPNKLLLIFPGAFKDCSLEFIKIPQHVFLIGYQAFYGCEDLREIIFTPNSQLNEIGRFAFDYCIKISKIELPDRMEKIGDAAFQHCSHLTDVKFPLNLKHIGLSAFAYCRRLNNISIPYGVTEILPGTFAGCENLGNVTLPASVRYIHDSAFADGTNIDTLKVSRNTAISENVFSVNGGRKSRVKNIIQY